MKEKHQKFYPLHEFYSRIYRKYDLVNRLFTLGGDMKWRRITARKCLGYQPETVIDLCCGTGDLTLLLRQLAPENVSVTGFDFNENMLNLAKEKAVKKQLKGIHFIQGDVASMPFNDSAFDSMTIGFGFRNLTFNNARIDLHMNEISRTIKKGGYMLVLESSVPQNAFMRFFYNLYLQFIMIPLGGIISGNRKAYRYLAHSSANFYTVPELTEIWNKFGFNLESVQTFFLGSANLIILRKK